MSSPLKPPPKKRQVIRPIVPNRLADFDEQVWPVNLAIVIFAGFTAGVIYATTDNFWDPRVLHNGFFRLSVVALLVAGLFWATALLRGRAARRVQFCVIVSLLLHMILAVMLREQYLRLAAQRQANEVDAEEEEERLILPEYFAPSDAESAPSEYDRPIPTKSPQESPETALSPPRMPVPEPERERTAEEETPAAPRASPAPRVELTAPRRMEAVTRPAERQAFEHQPLPDQPLLASPVRPNPAPPGRQPQPTTAEVARQDSSREFQPRTPIHEPDDRPRPEMPEAGRPTRSAMNPDVTPTAPTTRPSPSASPAVASAAEAAPAVAATAPQRNLEASPAPPQRRAQDDPIRIAAVLEAPSALEPASARTAPPAAVRRSESQEWQAVSDLAAAPRTRTTQTLRAEAAQAIPGVRPQPEEPTDLSPPVALSGAARMDPGSPLRQVGADRADAPRANLGPATPDRRILGEDRGAAPLSAGIPGQRSPQLTGSAGAGMPTAAAESPLAAATANPGRIDSSLGEISRDAGAPRLTASGSAPSSFGSDAPLVSLNAPAATNRSARRGESAASEGAVALGEVGVRAASRARWNAPGTPGIMAQAQPAAASQQGGAGGDGAVGGTGAQPNESALAVAGSGAEPQLRGGLGGDGILDVIAAGRLRGSEGDQPSGIGIGLPKSMSALRGSGESEGGFSGVLGNRRAMAGQARGREPAAALSGAMADALAAEGVVAQSGDTSGGAGKADATASSQDGMLSSAAGLDVPFSGGAVGPPIRGGSAAGSEDAPGGTSASALAGVFGRETGPLRIPGGGDTDPMAALPVGGGPVRRGQVLPGLPASLGGGPAEEPAIAGVPGDRSGGGTETAVSDWTAVRREGGLPVLRSDIQGEGGLGGPLSSRVGLPGRLSRPESEVVQDSASRFAAVRRTTPVPSVLGGTVPLEPAEAFLQRRPEDRGRRASELGGGPDTEEAVERALAFLARVQFPDGHWSLHAIPAESRLDPGEFASGTMRGDTAGTGLVLLAFLGAGYTHSEGRYQEVVQRGLKWLVTQQQADGRLYSAGADPDPFTRFYGHGLAAIALCEAYGMTRDPALREPVEKAVQFIVQSQHPQFGGWRYEPRRESDTSVTGWQLMALKSAEMAGLDVPRPVLDGVARWLDLAQTESGARYMYNPHAGETPSQIHGRVPNRAMTAEGLLMRIYLGWNRTHRPLVQGADFLRGQLPDFGTPQYRLRDAYYWYYATQVMFQMQGEHWRDWNARIRPMLLETQIREGDFAGSWDPLRPVPDRWAEQAGRLYVTASHTLILEVYYRHLPLFKTLEAGRP